MRALGGTRTAAWVASACAAIAACLVAAPLLGYPPVIRSSAVLVPMLAGLLAVWRPWRLDGPALRAVVTEAPSIRHVRFATVLAGAALFWIVLTRFQSGEINAVDFTVYFDRPAFQTWQGRPLFIETADLPEYSHRSLLGLHAYWVMLPLGYLYAVAASPMWLLALSVLAVVVGARYVFRIVLLLDAGGALAAASAIAFVVNDNTARTLSYGFHPEVLYAWFIPWLIHAGLRSHRASYLAAALSCVLVKEDACMPLFAAAVALALTRYHRMAWPDRLLFLLVPTALALANLYVFYSHVVPALNRGGGPTYSSYWTNYGSTPAAALIAMLGQPASVLTATFTSGFFKHVALPHLFLPLVAWRWTLGLVPIVLIYSASASESLRRFSVYYSIAIVPFLVIGASVGGAALARRFITHADRARLAAAIVILVGAVSVGLGYTLRPWRAEIAALPHVLARLGDERVVLIQSGLYPHAGYGERVQLLTREAIRSPRNAGVAIVLAPRMSGYPLAGSDLDILGRLPSIAAMPDGLVAVRLPNPATR
jgi:uncharacterized membrane protein